ncbi:calcium-binding protein [Nocardioides sp. zg-1230]|uniref:calcium-binding protein n=1 Tax=Nocardioides sp. zg-1230 TaxID=2736601 RepID=UPI001556E6B9|nr:calcium-binding protein [Nocardioides sp. zg-1230]NPC42065.1 hypothetical protein [Nocardioides sp. zg-1230]
MGGACVRRTVGVALAGVLTGLVVVTSGSATGAGMAPVLCGGRSATVEGTTPTVTGTPGPDVIVAGAAERVLGLGGDDIVCVDGGVGARVVHVDAGPDDDLVLLEGTALASGSSIDGGPGHDYLAASRPTGSLELDLRYLDRLSVEGQVLASVDGVEDAHLGAPTVLVIGTDEDNALSAHACSASLIGLRGDDRLRFVLGDPWFDADRFPCPTTVSMYGGPGDDDLVGSGGGDSLQGDDGRDHVRGRGGNDLMAGGAGRDVLEGGDGRDHVVGDDGSDVLRGNGGRDRLRGGAGRDTADGSAGRDRCAAERERRCER